MVNDLRGYARTQLRVTIGATTYRGLDEIPESLRPTLVEHAQTQLSAPKPTQRLTYQVGETQAEVWYEPARETKYVGGRSLGESRGHPLYDYDVQPSPRWL